MLVNSCLQCKTVFAFPWSPHTADSARKLFTWCGEVAWFLQVIKNISSKSDIYVERYCRTFFTKWCVKYFLNYTFERVKLRTYSKKAIDCRLSKTSMIGCPSTCVRSVFLPSGQSVSLSACQSVSLSACQSVSLSPCQSVNLSACQIVSFSVCRFVSMSVCQFVSLSIFQFVSLSVC